VRVKNIAVALVHSPDILILDEPTSAVDVEAGHELWQTIAALKGQGMTIPLTTHHLDEAEQLCSRIGIMKNGRIAKEGAVPELLSLVPAKAIALVEGNDTASLFARASNLAGPYGIMQARLGACCHNKCSWRRWFALFVSLMLPRSACSVCRSSTRILRSCTKGRSGRTRVPVSWLPSSQRLFHDSTFEAARGKFGKLQLASCA
jgi:hypothetical protein